MTLATPTSPPNSSSDTQAFFHKLRRHIELDRLQRSLDLHAVASKRLRRLPALHVVLLLLASVLFRDTALPSLALLLGLALPDKKGRFSVTSAALSAARQRLGHEALAAFNVDLVRSSLAGLPAEASWRGWRRFALDGSRFKLDDSPDNRAHFGGHRGRHGDSAFPLVRVLVLFEVFSRQVLDLAMGPYNKTTEFGLAEHLLASLPTRSMVLMDAGFFSLPLLWTLTQKGVAWMLPLHVNASYRVLERLGPSDWRVAFTTSDKAKKRCPEMPATMEMRVVQVKMAGFRPRLLATSLLDPVLYPASELAQQYGQRWQAELGLGEQKTVLAQQQPLRSRTPALVRQEVWALILAYNLLKQAGLAAARQLHVPACGVSFVRLLHRLRWLWVLWSVPSAERLAWLEQNVEDLRAEPGRPGRRCKREVKSRQSKFPAKKTRGRKKEEWEKTWRHFEEGEMAYVA